MSDTAKLIEELRVAAALRPPLLASPLLEQAAEALATAHAEIERLREALAGIERAISKGIRENGKPHHTITLPDGTVVTGPVADYFRNILVAIRDLAARSLSQAGERT